MKLSFKKRLTQFATDFEEVLSAYEPLAVRTFIFWMAVRELIRAVFR